MTTLPHVCIHCHARIANLGEHLRDAGNLDECPPESCPVLFRLRRGAP